MKRLLAIVLLVVIACPSIAQDADAKFDRDIQLYVDLLPKDSYATVYAAIKQFAKVKTPKNSKEFRQGLVELADLSKFKEFAANMGIEKHPGIERLKAVYAIACIEESGPLFVGGSSFIFLSEEIKKNGVTSLDDGRKEFVRKYHYLFFPDSIPPKPAK